MTRRAFYAAPVPASSHPPDLIGRAGHLDEFEYGLRQDSGAPGLLTIITGSRGIGKKSTPSTGLKSHSSPRTCNTSSAAGCQSA